MRWCSSSKPIWAGGQIEFVGEEWKSGLVNSLTQNPTATVWNFSKYSIQEDVEESKVTR